MLGKASTMLGVAVVTFAIWREPMKTTTAWTPPSSSIRTMQHSCQTKTNPIFGVYRNLAIRMQTEMDDETDDDDDGNGRTSNDDSFSSLEWDDFEGQILGDTRMLRDGDTAEKKLDETVVFDDFGSSFLVGDCDSSNSNRRTVGLSSSSSLADRIQRVQSQQVRQDAITSRNWKLGHWQVRGFSFDDNDDESIHEPVEYAVTRIVQATPTDTDDETMTRDLVWVGRSDGCVFGIRLGTDYLTKLPEGRGPSKSVKSYNEIRSDKEMMDDDDDDENDEYEQRSDLTATTRPFEVVVRLQRQHSDEDRVAGRIPIGPVDALAVMESTDVGSETIVNVFTASSDSPGTIQKWELVWGSIVNNYKNHENDVPATSSSMLCPPICSSVHSNSPIRYLQTLQLKSNTRSKNTEQNDCRKILLSADSYKFAVWDAQNGVLLKKCRVNESLPAFAEASLSTTTANKKNVVDDPIICSVHANGSHVYVGTMTGQVLVYSIADILSSSVEICPAGQWRASQGPVTSVACGGLGSLGRNRPDAAPTTVIYTGDSQGLVKQWEIFSGGHKMEAWPKLATQRLPKKAHLFSGHDGNVTAIMAVDAVKFVTGATDGTVRVWNTGSGKELFRMDGFPDPIRSLCLFDGGGVNELSSTAEPRNNLLITDGMNKYVCVNDFSTSVDDEDFDLEMPEYLKG